MPDRPDPSDLSDAEGAVLEPLLPSMTGSDRPRSGRDGSWRRRSSTSSARAERGGCCRGSSCPGRRRTPSRTAAGATGHSGACTTPCANTRGRRRGGGANPRRLSSTRGQAHYRRGWRGARLRCRQEDLRAQAPSAGGCLGPDPAAPQSRRQPPRHGRGPADDRVHLDRGPAAPRTRLGRRGHHRLLRDVAGGGEVVARRCAVSPQTPDVALRPGEQTERLSGHPATLGGRAHLRMAPPLPPPRP